MRYMKNMHNPQSNHGSRNLPQHTTCDKQRPTGKYTLMNTPNIRNIQQRRIDTWENINTTIRNANNMMPPSNNKWKRKYTWSKQSRDNKTTSTRHFANGKTQTQIKWQQERKYDRGEMHRATRTETLNTQELDQDHYRCPTWPKIFLTSRALSGHRANTKGCKNGNKSNPREKYAHAKTARKHFTRLKWASSDFYEIHWNNQAIVSRIFCSLQVVFT